MLYPICHMNKISRTEKISVLLDFALPKIHYALCIMNYAFKSTGWGVKSVSMIFSEDDGE